MEAVVSRSQEIAERNDELIRKYRETGDEAFRDEFFEFNQRFARHIAEKYTNIGEGPDERFSIGLIGLLKAFNTYKLDAGVKFNTYAGRVITNELFMHQRKVKKHYGRTVSIDEPIMIDRDGHELTRSDVLDIVEHGFENYDDQEFTGQVLMIMKAEFTAREWHIYENCIAGKMLQNDYGKMIGLSQSMVSRLIKRITKKIHKIGQRLLSDPPKPKKELKDMGATKLTVRTRKGDLPSAEVNGMISYLLNNAGASNMAIHRFLGVAYPQVGSVKRRIDNGKVFEHVHPSRHGFNINDLFNEQTDAVKEEKKVEVKQSLTGSSAGLNKAISDAVAKDLHVASKLTESTSIPEVLATQKSLDAIEEFADKMADERAKRRERDQKLTEAKQTVFRDPEFPAYEEAIKNVKAEAWKTMEKDLGLPPLSKQMVETMTLNTKGTGHALAEIVSILVKALDPEKTYKLHLVYEEL